MTSFYSLQITDGNGETGSSSIDSVLDTMAVSPYGKGVVFPVQPLLHVSSLLLPLFTFYWLIRLGLPSPRSLRATVDYFIPDIYATIPVSYSSLQRSSNVSAKFMCNKILGYSQIQNKSSDWWKETILKWMNH